MNVGVCIDSDLSVSPPTNPELVVRASGVASPDWYTRVVIAFSVVANGDGADAAAAAAEVDERGVFIEDSSGIATGGTPMKDGMVVAASTRTGFPSELAGSFSGGADAGGVGVG